MRLNRVSLAMRASLTLCLLAVAGIAGAAQADGRAKFRSPFVAGQRMKELPDGPLVRILGNDHVDAKQYRDLSRAIQTLLKRYPADRHYFIGTGRDPAPIIAALENIGGRAMAMNFPASNIVQSNNITPELLVKYFQRLIPNEGMRRDILSGRRTLVLLDQSSTGKTPDSLAPYFREFFDHIGSKAKMIKLAFAQPGDGLIEGVRKISTGPMPDVGTYLYAPYEGIVSEYPRHVLGHDRISQLVQRNAYVRFKAAVLERMKRDKGLHRFLMQEGGPAFRSESPAERQARIETEAREARELAELKKQKELERREAAARRAEVMIEKAKALPETMKTTLGKMIESLPERSGGHEKGPYLSESAKQLNTWLGKSLKVWVRPPRSSRR
jgi:hypothetical protein